MNRSVSSGFFALVQRGCSGVQWFFKEFTKAMTRAMHALSIHNGSLQCVVFHEKFTAVGRQLPLFNHADWRGFFMTLLQYG